MAQSKVERYEEESMWLERVQTYGRLIKFSHTIFALPFALAAVLLANRQHPVSWLTLGCIVLAMAAARSAAMGFNRFADYEYDRRNPRTVDRPLTAGKIDKRSVLIFIAVSSGLFIVFAALLGPLCLKLSLPLLFVLFFYSYTKRFTSFSHLFLGFAIGLSPLATWIAITGTWSFGIVFLSLALMTYIAGFDILYACQDVDFDREQNLFSIPSRWGVHRAFQVAAGLHLATFFFLIAVYFAFDLSSIYLAFLAVISLLLVLEHRLVRPDRLEKIDLAFFHVNSAISVLLFLAVLADTWYS